MISPIPLLAQVVPLLQPWVIFSLLEMKIHLSKPANDVLTNLSADHCANLLNHCQ